MEQKIIGKVFSEAELVELARKELNEDPARTPKDIKALKEWIKKQPHLAKTAKQGKYFHKHKHKLPVQCILCFR